MTQVEIAALYRLSTATRARDHLIRRINRNLTNGLKVRVTRAHYSDAPFTLIDATNAVMKRLDARQLVLFAAELGVIG